MFSFAAKNLRFIEPRILLVLLLAFSVGCVDRTSNKSTDPRTDRDDVMKALNTKILPSAHYLIFPSDIEKFRPERPKIDLLKDIQWRGNFGMAAAYKGNNTSAIAYKLVSPEEPETKQSEGEWVFAIFVDDKFVKLVRTPKPEAKDIEKVADKGTPSRCPGSA